MYDLTPRQIEILKCIVKEYTDSAEAVGSETLEKKYDIGVSPATIRNEMADLVKLGYLSKPHTSAGRVPTSKALKFYINELMKEKELTVADEVKAKETVWDFRADEDKFLRELTRNLARNTKTLAVATTDEGDLFFAGYSNILDMPEFYDIDITKNLLNMLDDFSYFDVLLQKVESDFSILFGDELGNKEYNPYGFVFSRYHTRGNHSGSVGIIGPTRLRYENVVPFVKYFGTLVDEIADW